MNRTSISDLKAKAKDQLLGNYGIATGSFALLFVLVYAIMIVLMSAITSGFMKNGSYVFESNMWGQVLSQVLGMVIAIITMLFTVGYIQIMRRIAYGERPVLSDLFHVFRNHPDKVIIVSFVMTAAQFVFLLPAMIVSGRGLVIGTGADAHFDGKKFLLWIILYIAGFAVSVFIDIMLSMSFLIYLDEPETGVTEIMSGSVSMMKGNKFRYFYMTLSFIGYWFLAILSFGIAFLWVVPYQTMTMVEFYKDLRGDI